MAIGQIGINGVRVMRLVDPDPCKEIGRVPNLNMEG